MNTLYYGDNLKILRDCIREDSFGMLPLKPGTQVPSPASVRKDADRAEDNSSSVIPGAVTPEEPALQAGAPAFPGYRVIGQPEDLDGAKELAERHKYGFQWRMDWPISAVVAKKKLGR